MKEIVYYMVTKNSDTTEGRGRTVPTGIAFTEKEDAIKFAGSPAYGKFAVMGVVNEQYAKYNVEQVQLVVFDNLKEYNDRKYELENLQRKQKALAKLTKEDREALGI